MGVPPFPPFHGGSPYIIHMALSLPNQPNIWLPPLMNIYEYFMICMDTIVNQYWSLFPMKNLSNIPDEKFIQCNPSTIITIITLKIRGHPDRHDFPNVLTIDFFWVNVDRAPWIDVPFCWWFGTHITSHQISVGNLYPNNYFVGWCEIQWGHRNQLLVDTWAMVYGLFPHKSHSTASVRYSYLLGGSSHES